MNLLMCTGCGEFVTAIADGESLWPLEDACPICGGTEFKDNETGRIVDTAESE